MFEKSIKCSGCGREYPFSKKIFRCERCEESLEVTYDYPKLRKILTRKKLDSRPFSHSRYLELFPVKNILSIGEGGTPLIRSKNLERRHKLGFRVWFKLEMQNPTGSFKDRGSSVEVAKALEKGAKSVVCASTGNMGASVSAYSGISDLPCYIFTPEDAADTKLKQILAHGAKVYQMKGDYTVAAKLVERASKELGHYLLGDYLFRREGTKSVGFEIADQLPNVDYVSCPVGNGTLISAIWKAFKEFKELRLIKKTPKMIGIQAENCNPITKAFKAKSHIEPVCGRTVAVAMECGEPLDGTRAYNSISESEGFAEDVTDDEILKARELLARREGIFAEPAGAASFAGILKSKYLIKKDSDVVCVVTGHGLKTPRTDVPGKVHKIGAKPDLKSLFR
ncbi:MAG: threonine synthase [Deltaproteobacteria bacterium]|nr:threonine synthase [Deltaproteobacteria bacterium]